MNDDGKGRYIVAIFVVLLLATTMISAMSIGVKNSGYTPKFVESILKNANNYNTPLQNAPKIKDEGGLDEKDERKEKEREMTDGYALLASKRQTAKGGVVIEQSTRRVLKGENMYERCYPASVTKILTALVALENLPLEKVVKVPAEAAGVEGSSLYLRAGDEISVEDLLFGLMLRSGNDAAVALAVETAGSVENFVGLMNERAVQAGAVSSHFVNPHGLNDPEHFTTAYDMALIAADAYENEDFCRIVSTKVRKICVNGVETAIANKNKLLKLFEGANGVKTGYTTASGRCLAGAAKRDGMQLISVVFNYDDMWNDTVRLLNFGFDNFKLVPVDEGLMSKGKDEILCRCLPEGEDWEQLAYPMKKDGSERLVLS